MRAEIDLTGRLVLVVGRADRARRGQRSQCVSNVEGSREWG